MELSQIGTTRLFALMYPITTHRFLLDMDHLVSIGQLQGLKMKDKHNSLAHPHAYDTLFLSQNNPNDALKLYELVVGLHVNFNKSKLLSLPP